MSTRILEKNTFFKIGEIEFYVASTEPYDFGKVTSKSLLRCPKTIEKSSELERITLVPLRNLDISRSILLE